VLARGDVMVEEGPSGWCDYLRDQAGATRGMLRRDDAVVSNGVSNRSRMTGG
jgi:hypothetical protein